MKALVSVSDKQGVVELCAELSKLGVEILSTGGTAKALQEAKVRSAEVGAYTGFPEMMGGRLKTLHPKIFGGILYQRADAGHRSDAEAHGIDSIDWVVCNLYPFEKIHMENKLPKPEMIEFIDIGGVSLLRAAGKNFQDVVVLCDPADYTRVLTEFKENKSVSLRTKKELAAKAFAHTAHYDSMIAKFFMRSDELAGAKPAKKEEFNPFPEELTVGLRKVADLRYGENPQQKAALYQDSGDRAWGVVNAQKIQGKELSFNNYIDLDSAWQIANSLAGIGNMNSKPACVIIKHTNPCGSAVGATVLDAYQTALACDPVSAFGGIIGFSATLDEATAVEIAKTFYECIIAPEYSPEALEILKKKPNLRVLRQSTVLSLPYELDLKKVAGGVLVQEKDHEPAAQDAWKVMSKRQPTAEELHSLQFAWRVCWHVKSNAIVLARGMASVGVGAGQMSRIDSLKIAIQKAGLVTPEKVAARAALPIQGGLNLPLVMASDAFFPFRDCVDEAAKAGVSAIVQPGGSIRDQESVEAANEHNIALVFTGLRHFKH